MAYNRGNRIYWYDPNGYEEKEIGGVMHYRHDSIPAGEWRVLPHPVDRLLGHLFVLTKPKTQIEMLRAMHIDSATASRVRNGMKMPLEWFVKMADYTGLTLAELRTIAGVKPELKRYNESE